MTHDARSIVLLRIEHAYVQMDMAKSTNHNSRYFRDFVIPSSLFFSDLVEYQKCIFLLNDPSARTFLTGRSLKKVDKVYQNQNVNANAMKI